MHNSTKGYRCFTLNPARREPDIKKMILEFPSVNKFASIPSTVLSCTNVVVDVIVEESDTKASSINGEYWAIPERAFFHVTVSVNNCNLFTTIL
jgi:hypothetical protein